VTWQEIRKILESGGPITDQEFELFEKHFRENAYEPFQPIQETRTLLQQRRKDHRASMQSEETKRLHSEALGHSDKLHDKAMERSDLQHVQSMSRANMAIIIAVVAIGVSVLAWIFPKGSPVPESQSSKPQEAPPPHQSTQQNLILTNQAIAVSTNATQSPTQPATNQAIGKTNSAHP
jgi:hypothetical protein